MVEKRNPKNKFSLEIPLDASQIEDFKPEQELKVIAQRQDGSVISRTTKLSEKGQGSVNFAFDEHPGEVRIIVGPSTASDEELLGMQTISVNVSLRQWGDSTQARILPILISPYYWFWWLRWCRTFTIRGRVVCPDGSPVPGALVCASDVDMWWWWSSTQQVGCATTDAFGAFEIRFRWCCGWWPWWWWQCRAWRLEPSLSDRILPALKGLNLKRLPLPTPKPDLALFEGMLAENDVLTQPANLEVEPSSLHGLRDRLLERLPVIPELNQLRLWPWWPWSPWWDCTPDIIFKVTQNCGGQDKIIVDENVWNTRWNIPTNLNVTLTANDQACCIVYDPPPAGNCMVISDVCDNLLKHIGGNVNASALPLGYVNPGVKASLGDRPFAGAANISGQFGTTSAVDYYEFEWTTSLTTMLVIWNPMPPAAAGGFSRTYWGPEIGGGPVDFHSAKFAVTPINGHNVIETREHFEANNDPTSWGISRFWVSNRDFLMQWLTQNNFADGTYYLRVNSWSRPGYVGDLTHSRILHTCDTETENSLVLTIDNQIIVPASAHGDPCGSGTVHICTSEPDTAFTGVYVNGMPAESCTVVDASAGGTLDIDFIAHDPDGHLAYYTLEAHYGVNSVVNLLAATGASVAPTTAAHGIPMAAQEGPTYADALTLPQTAVSPYWNGGSIRLHMDDLRKAFPETCCYQLRLVAYKRTIVDCYGGTAHYNVSEYSLTVTV